MLRNKVRKMQQGGGLSVFSPQPKNFITPLEGLDPNVFKYNLDTSPMDVSSLIQVMQTKDSFNIQRERAAIEREEIKARKDIEESKLQHQRAKMMMDLQATMFKNTGIKLGPDGSQINDDITTSKRYLTEHGPKLEYIKQLEQENSKLALNFADKSAPTKLMENMQKIKEIQTTIPTKVEENLDRTVMKNLFSVLEGKAKDKSLNPFLFKNVLDQRSKYLDMDPAGDGYQYGSTIAGMQGLTFSPSQESKKFQSLFELNNKAYDTAEVSQHKMMGAGVVINEKGKVFKNAETAAKDMADAIMKDPSLKSYTSTMMGIDLYSKGPYETDGDTLKKLSDVLLPQFNADDEALLKAKQQNVQVIASAPKVKISAGGKKGSGSNSSSSKKGKSGGAKSAVLGSSKFDALSKMKRFIVEESLDQLEEEGYDFTYDQVIDAIVSNPTIKNSDEFKEHVKQKGMKEVEGSGTDKQPTNITKPSTFQGPTKGDFDPLNPTGVKKTPTSRFNKMLQGKQ